MDRKGLIIGWVIIGILLTTLIMLNINYKHNQRSAEQIMHNYFNQVEQKQYQKITSLLASKMLVKLSQKDYVNLLKFVNQKHGKLLKYQLQDYKFRKKIIGENKGNYCILLYKINYVNSVQLQKFVLFKSNNKSKLRLLRHEFVSNTDYNKL